MKNPQITQTLNTIMADELTEKKEAIKCILDHYKVKGQVLDEFTFICELMELSIGDISQILSDLISNAWSEINRKSL